ncbi:DUF3912 family protein [Idiomarina sp.]|uniref:DUF3912 family protein n=1 Tax=Idiomarina sp. TaxID=1874361 RepID=UPI0025C22B23|nr:DUF3912 family protein [Idiomarina sp.]NQZ04497.1 DUF3912 family protein [Idiomarina sp.]
MAGPTFSYNNPRINGQTIFVKRGPHCGKLGIVKQQNQDGSYLVSQADFGAELISFKREEFIVYRYRKIKVPIERVAGRNPDVL